MTFARMPLMAVAALTLFVGANSARADYDHIDRLALDVQLQTQQMRREFAIHYRHTHEYGHLLSDATQMYALAARLHALAHHHADPHHMEIVVDQLDRLFHHVEGLLEHTERSAHFGDFHDHVHGHTGHVHAQMQRLSQDLHHLRSDLKVLSQATHHHYDDGYHHHHGYGAPGFSFGRGGFSFRFGR